MSYALQRRGVGDVLAPAGSEDAARVASAELAATMVLRGAAGALIAAAAAPRGKEGVWGVVGFGAGAITGQYGILAVVGAALWRKMGT